MSATNAEIERTGALVDDFSAAIAARIPGVTHEDATSAAVAVAVHHAVCMAMPLPALLAFVVDAYEARAKGGER